MRTYIGDAAGNVNSVCGIKSRAGASEVALEGSSKCRTCFFESESSVLVVVVVAGVLIVAAVVAAPAMAASVVADSSVASTGETDLFSSLSRFSRPLTRRRRASRTSVFGSRFFGMASIGYVG